MLTGRKSDSALASPNLNIVQIEIPYASEVLAKHGGNAALRQARVMPSRKLSPAELGLT